jgi:plastocyanin
MLSDRIDRGPGVIRVPTMRPPRLLLPLTTLIALAAAAPATAADWTVDVTDFQFTPADRSIAVGDTVTWTFTNGGHTATAVRGQADSWDSGPKGAGTTFQRTFTRPGRFQYVCTPHRSFMKGVIEVGEDEETDTVGAVRARRSGRSVTIGFRLNEAAVATLALRGPTRRTVERGRLGAGRQSIRIRRLKPGRYRGVLRLADDFDKRSTARTSFRIG